MTWSIIARDESTGRIGIAVATRFFAVGALVPNIRTGVGAVSNQAWVNPYFGPRGLALLAAGARAEDTVRMLLTADEGRDHRQLHVMDRHGRAAAGTGSACVAWCGHLVLESFSVAGNMLASETVIQATAETYAAQRAQPLARRLLAAMRAGEEAGGDKRGKQSAALLIHDSEEYPLVDIRVDDHADPLAELARLETVHRERFVHFRRYGPRRDDATGLVDRAKLEEAIAGSIAEKFE